MLNRLKAALGGHAKTFADVDTYCMFIGYPRSGHSLIGSLLDAHPEILIAHEADVLASVAEGLDKAGIFRTCYENSRGHAEAGRAETGYSYEVPGQFQGRHERLRVIGDKKGGRSSIRLGQDPALLEKLITTLDDTRLRMVHVTRNPFDNITTMTTYGKPFEEAIDWYFSMCDAVAGTKERVGSDMMLDVRHEDVIADCEGQLRRMCAFLGVQTNAEYLAACASILFQKPNKTRAKIDWSADAIARVHEGIARYPFLSTYTFDS